MFGPLGIPELLLIFFVILVVFGPRRLPEIGRTLGKALGEFRKATDDLKNTIEREVRLEELKQAVPSLVAPFESISRNEPVAVSPSLQVVESPSPASSSSETRSLGDSEPATEPPSLQVAESSGSPASSSSEPRRLGDSEPAPESPSLQVVESPSSSASSSSETRSLGDSES
jgi:TatA/E family protein of Tat protein translocase